MAADKISIENFEGQRGKMSSPLTLEAVFQLGIDVADLYPKSEIDLLKAAGYRKTAVADLAKHYEERRQTLISDVKERRSQLKATLGRTSRSMGGTGLLPPGTPGAGTSSAFERRASKTVSVASPDPAAHADALRDAAVERERKRAEFAKQKQAKEMADLMEGEIKLAQQAAAAAALERERVAKEAEARAAREREKKKATEERRKADMARLAEEDERAEAMRKAAHDTFLAESKKLEEEKAAYKALLASRRAAEEEHRAQQVAADRAREAELEEQARTLAVRLADWEAKEADRTAKMEAFRAKLKAEAEAKAEAAAERLDAALARDVERMLMKRHAYEERVAEAETRRREREAKEEERLRKRAAARAVKSKKMADALKRTRDDELAWIAKLASSASKEDAVLAKVRAEKVSEAEERARAALLTSYDRAAALRQRRKAEEYERMQRLVAAMDAEKARDAEAAERARLARERQEHQKRLLLMKAHAARELEGMKGSSDFSKLARMVESARGGAGSGDGGEEEAGAGGGRGH